MATTADREIGLGTVFTGKVDASFLMAIRRLRTAIGELAAAQTKASKMTGQKGMTLYDELSGTQKLMGNAVGESKKYQEALRKLADTSSKTGMSQKVLKAELDNVEKGIHRQAQRMTNAGLAGNKYADYTSRTALLNRVLNGEIKVTSKGFERVQQATEKAAAAKEKAVTQAKRLGNEYANVGKKLSKISGGMERLTSAFKVVAAYGIAGTATYAVIGGITGAIKEIAEYDQALKNLQAVTSATDGQTAAMAETMKQVASTTRFSTREVADAMVLLGQAGLTANEIINATNAVAMLATGTLTDMATSSDLLTTALRAYNLDATQSNRLADVFANAVNRSKLTVDKLRVAFSYVGPVANKAGMSVEETSAAMMILANAGLRASTIGTALRQSIGRLLAPTTQLKEAFKDAGANFDRLNPKTTKFIDIIRELQKIVKGAGDAYRLFGLRAASAIAALTEAGPEGFDRMYGYLMRTGAATEMAEKQMEGLGVMTKNLKDKVSVLAVTIGEGGLTQALKMIVGPLGEFVDLLIKAAGSPITQFILGATTLTAVLYGLRKALQYVGVQFAALALGKSLGVIKRYSTQFGILTAVLKGAGNILGSLVSMIVKFPLKIGILAGIPALLTLITMLAGRTEKLRIEDEKLSRQHAAASTNLQNYQKRLEGVTEGSMEHKYIIQQLVREYPELKAVIVDANGAIDAHRKAIDDLNKKYKELSVANAKKSLAGYMKEITSLTNKIKSLGDSAKNKKTFEAIYGVGTANQSIGQMDKMKGKMYDLEQKRLKLFYGAAALVKELEKMGVAVDYETLGIPKDVLDSYLELGKVLPQLDKEWDAMSEKERGDTQRNMMKGMGKAWEEYYEQVNDVTKAELALAAEAVDKQILDLEDKVKEGVGSLTTDQLERKKNDMRLEALRKFKEKEMREEAEAAGIKLKINENYLKLVAEQEKQGQGLSEDFSVKKLNIELATMREVLAAERSHLDAIGKMYGLESNEYLKQKEKVSGAELDIEEKKNAQIAAVKQATEKKRKEAEKRDELKLKIQENIAEREVYQAQARNAKEADMEDELTMIRVNGEVDRAKATVALRKKNYNTLLAENLEYNNDVLEAEEDLRRAELDLAQAEAAKSSATRKIALAKIRADEEIAEKRLKIAVSNQRAEGEAEIRGALASADSKKDIRLKELEANVEEARMILKIREDGYKKIKASGLVSEKDLLDLQANVSAARADLEEKLTAKFKFEQEQRIEDQDEALVKQLVNVQKFSDAYTAIMEERHRIGRVSDEELTKYYVEQWKWRNRETERFYRLGKASEDEYMAYLKKSKELGLIDEEEYARKRITIQGTWLEQLKQGIDDASVKMKTMGETWMEIGELMGDQIATGLNDGLWDVATRAKTAKEAMKDFARESLLWISKLITKTLILKAVQSGLSGLGGGATDVQMAGAGYPVGHEGWIAGSARSRTKFVPHWVFKAARKMHGGGLAGDEVPAILKKGEGVFTPEQMQAMGAGAGGMNINIYTMDTVTMAQFLNRHKKAFAATMVNEYRTSNSITRRGMRG